MKREQFESLVRQLLARRPFRAFRVRLMDGETIRIDHPEAMIMRGGLAVFVDRKGVAYDFDEESVSYVGRGGNGASRR